MTRRLRSSATTMNFGQRAEGFLYLVFAVIEPSRTNKPAPRPLGLLFPQSSSASRFTARASGFLNWCSLSRWQCLPSFPCQDAPSRLAQPAPSARNIFGRFYNVLHILWSPAARGRGLRGLTFSFFLSPREFSFLSPSRAKREQFPTRHDKAVRAQSIRGRMELDGLYVPARAP
jgi:hypothetical protein